MVVVCFIAFVVCTALDVEHDYFFYFTVVSVHVLDTRMPISLQFPTVEDTRGTMEWMRMEDSLFLPAQALLEYSTNGKLLIMLLCCVVQLLYSVCLDNK